MGAIEEILALASEIISKTNERKLVLKLKNHFAKLQEDQSAIMNKNWEYISQIRALKESGGSHTRQIGDYLEEIAKLKEANIEQKRSHAAEIDKIKKIHAEELAALESQLCDDAERKDKIIDIAPPRSLGEYEPRLLHF